MIHRKEVQLGERFAAPYELTFGYKSIEGTINVWYNSIDSRHPRYCEYMVVGTGHVITEDYKLMQTIVVNDLCWHLIRLL
jgi:hypothetical protein